MYFSEAHREKLSIAALGNKNGLGHRKTDASRKAISKGHKGKRLTDEHRKKLSQAKLGKVLSEEHRKKIAESHRGEKSHFWDGGKTAEGRLIRGSIEYKLWRQAVFRRDDWRCVWCCKRGIELNADHIRPFSTHPELRLELSNGRTLCVECHKTTDTYKGRALKLKLLKTYGNAT